MTDNNVVDAPETSEKSGNPAETAKKSKLDLSTIYGVKAGMTRIFSEHGEHIPVTVVKLVPNYVSQVKTIEKDGYEAYQIAYYKKREKLIKKPLQGHLAKAGLEKNLARFAEVKTSSVEAENLGKEVSLGKFTPNTYVDVSGTSKGKGFQGVIKRHGFSGGPASHGSKFHRGPGSIGQSATPGRVFANKKMPGQMGNVKKTVQNLKVVEVNEDKGYLLIKGSVPGAKNSFVKISTSIKKTGKTA